MCAAMEQARKREERRARCARARARACAREREREMERGREGEREGVRVHAVTLPLWVGWVENQERIERWREGRVSRISSFSFDVWARYFRYVATHAITGFVLPGCVNKHCPQAPIFTAAFRVRSRFPPDLLYLRARIAILFAARRVRKARLNGTE